MGLDGRWCLVEVVVLGGGIAGSGIGIGLGVRGFLEFQELGRSGLLVLG